MGRLRRITSQALLTCTLLGMSCGESDLVEVSQSGDSGPVANDEETTSKSEDAMATLADINDSSGGEVDDNPSPGCDDILAPVTETLCDNPPLVFAHGFLASGDTFARHASLFRANGYSADKLHVFDWNTFDQGADHGEALDAIIDDALTSSGCEQVILMGHSAGGGLSVSYLEEAKRASKVSKYIHIGSFPMETNPGPEGAGVPSLFLWSAGDLAVPVSGETDIPACMGEAEMSEQDHYLVATSPESFEAIYQFIFDSPPAVMEVPVSDEAVDIGGRVLTLGENQPLTAELTITEYEAGTGALGEVLWTGMSDESGWWDGAVISPQQGVVITVQTEGQLPIHYYREGQITANPLIYLRMLGSDPESISGLLTALLNFSESSSVLVIFSVNRALTAGVDSLKIDGVEMLDDELAPPEKTAIALFFQDSNGDGEAGPVDALLSSFPFLNGKDIYLAPGNMARVEFNEKEFLIPNRAADPEGVSILVLE